MSIRTTHIHLLALTFGVSIAASAAYITPWYANPTLTARIGMGAKNFVPVSMSLSGSGEKLAVSCEANGSFTNLRVIDTVRVEQKEGANTQNVNSNACQTAVQSSSFSLGDTPLLAAHGNSLLGIDADNGAAADFTLAARHWVGDKAPEARTFSAAPDATSFAFDSAGALWSNATDPSRTGHVVKRTLSGSAYAETDTIDTGLAAVDAVAVYAVNGTEYAFAAAQGKVVTVNLSTRTVATLVDDATHLDATVKSVKMSHTNYFRPRLYVLLATGDIAVYYLDETAATAT